MNEQEWSATTDPLAMLPFLRGGVSDRKLRLFAVACCRSLERVLCDEAVHLLGVSERFADGRAQQSRWGDCPALDVLRDVFGNPFRPVTADPAWRTSTVVSLAEGIYADRAFDRLPILADALQDAGCHDADVLAHCRGEGPHVRGCWLVDLLLGKG